MTARSRAQAFCDRFGLRAPILQAPMAGANPPALAAAVASAGGLGGFGALMSSPAQMRDWAAQFRSASNGAFQINLWAPEPEPLRDPAHEARVREALSRLSGIEVPEAGPGPFLQDFGAQCDALLEAAPAVASSIMGLFPPEMVARLKARGIAWFCNATTVAEARAAEAAGADAVVAQGAEAGGHRGSFENAAAERSQVGLFALLPQMADAVRIPVIAAGGVMDGRGIAAALILGASAVQMGTAFLRSPEAAIHPAWAAEIARTAPEDTVLTRGFSGRLARGIRNQVTELFAGGLPPAPYPVQRVLMAKVRAAAEAANEIGRMQAWAGQGAALAKAEPAGEILRRLWAEAEALLF
ncbi:NAD(P)H-dependent flavin oxidoreductase [Paracraurococcus lichenis]|uniref:Propionate 3-nitronate monooxygenase n=1 Tax=Paracraurococcus lichenis TaxID=3064888 RepID=A0ABT9DSL6_9PROT|nr:nitronate monooxygenase [Paracraurococcus sp. LOR1-02]MDO9706886.1 nitronate monooxygenase [Paracraurococcus sp. LOR1-02]